MKLIGKGVMARIAVIGLVGRSMFFEMPRFHTGGETIHATNFHEEWGGKGFNQEYHSEVYLNQVTLTS